MTPLDTLLDLLDHGCDGEPRWIALDVADADGAASLVRVVTSEAERRGYLPLPAERFASVARTLPDEQRHRTFALLHTCRAPARPDASALVQASLVNPRPHVLVTVSITGAASRPLAVREARAIYAPAPSRDALPVPGPEGAKHVARAERAIATAHSGRHEAAVRIAREALAAVSRRQDAAPSWHIGILLGRLLLERGRVTAAERAFADAASAVEAVSPRKGAVARIWLALARTDAGRLTEAESLLRAVKVTGALAGEAHARWADAALARCLLWQARAAEAAELLEGDSIDRVDTDPMLVVTTLSTHSRVLLTEGRTFDAGQRARAAVEWADRSGDVLLQAIAGTAHLRVLAAAGDLALASERKARVLAHAQAMHAPLRALRARVIWLDMLRRCGRTHEAAAEATKLARLARAAPPLLRRHIQQIVAAPAPSRVLRDNALEHVPFAIVLLRAAHDEDDDHAAARRVLDTLAAQTRAARVDLQSSGAGPMSTLVSVGNGIVPSLGTRACEAGIVIGPECLGGAWEAAAPVRLGHRVLGALACRWPLGRAAIAGAGATLDLAAAVLAPRVELLLSARAESARAATEVPELLGVSSAMGDLRRAIARAAGSPFAVLIEGESGVGKELVARAIHQLSARRDGRFCDVNCAALPDDLVESELFGHARGAFTGALVERRGLFDEASGGTLFLDELPDLSLRAQAKLLRVLQQGEIRRVGESFSRPVDVRMVTATNRAMDGEVAAGRFRQDLLYRLDVIRISIPPLRDRPEDVPVLARHFWKGASARTGTTAALSHGVLAELARYHWPGNVRELQNVMSALAVGAPSRGTVRPALLPSAITGAVAVSSARLSDARRQFDRRFVEVALARAGGSRIRAAAQLGISRQGLLKLMAKLGL
jgi:DNA-binding NtrC family response regulator